MHLAAFIFDI